MAPAIAVGFGTHWLARARGFARAIPAGIAAGVACYLLVGALVVFKDPFPAEGLPGGRRRGVRVLIGETGGRTYLGDVASASPRRVLSIPQSQVARMVVGGRERELRGRTLRRRRPMTRNPQA